MPTRTVVLGDQQPERVVTLVASGRYQNASEVLHDGLRLIEQRERIEQANKLKAPRRAASHGWAAPGLPGPAHADRAQDLDDEASKE